MITAMSREDLLVENKEGLDLRIPHRFARAGIQTQIMRTTMSILTLITLKQEDTVQLMVVGEDLEDRP